MKTISIFNCVLRRIRSQLMALRSVGEATVMESIKTLVFTLQDELGELNDQEQMLTKQVNNVHDTIECGAQGACSIIIRLY